MATTHSHYRNSQRRLAGTRRGATILETAITLPVTLLVLFALLDLGIAATRYNVLADVTRRIARQAVMHGSLAPASLGTWGPVEFNGTVADNSVFVSKAQGMVPTMNPSDVIVRVTWPDNDNSPHDRVQVEANYSHVPLVPGLCPWGTLNLRSESSMRIVN